MGAEKGAGCGLHGFQAQRPSAVPRKARNVRRTDALVVAAVCAAFEDTVLVGLAGYIGTGMEVRLRVDERHHPNGRGKPSVQRPVQAVGRNGCLQRHRDSLRLCVDAGVSSP